MIRYLGFQEFVHNTRGIGIDEVVGVGLRLHNKRYAFGDVDSELMFCEGLCYMNHTHTHTISCRGWTKCDAS